MSLRRPRHLVRRQIRGRAFSEPINLYRVDGERNNRGQLVETVGPAIPTKCATAPASGSDARVRELMEGGVDLGAMRNFWTVEDVNPAEEGGGRGDIIEFLNERYRVQSTQRWGGFSESLCILAEEQ